MIDTIFIFGAKYLFILSILLALYCFFKSNSVTRRRMIVFGFFSLLLTMTVAICLRHAYFNPRPFVVGNFTPLIPHSADNGFPSDHTLLVSAIASVFIFFKKRLAVILWVIAIIVAVSRVYVGVHHPIDVIASMLIALLSSIIVHTVLKRKRSVIITE